MALKDAAIRNAMPKERPYKLADGGGMYLSVVPSGGKLWRLKYRFEGKEKLLALGGYPDVGLADARERRDEARKLLAKGIDPGAARKQEKAEKAERAKSTFKAVALEWHEKHEHKWCPRHGERIKLRFERDVFPSIGAKPIREVLAPDLLAVIRRVEGRGVLDTAHRTLQYCGQVLRYAVATGRADRDPSADLRGALPPVKSKHHAAVTEPKAVGALLRSMEGYEGSPVVRCALRLAPLVFVRPGELRHAEWSEFDLDRAEWRIPAERMKMKVQHLVPLSRQAVAILGELQPLTGSGKYLFPSVRTGARPISNNTVNAALRRLGYTGDEQTGHGFRSIASTLLNESGRWHRDAIERQLAHAERDQVRGAYNYAEHLPERRKMMQWWADELERLREGAEVIPFRKRKGVG